MGEFADDVGILLLATSEEGNEEEDNGDVIDVEVVDDVIGNTDVLLLVGLFVVTLIEGDLIILLVRREEGWLQPRSDSLGEESVALSSNKRN